MAHPMLIPMPGGGAFRGPASPRKACPIDGPQNWYVPQEANHFVALGLNVPDFLYLCNEASSSLQSAIGSLALGAVGAPLYRQTVAGWARPFVGATYDTQGGFTTTSALLDLATGESGAVMALAAAEAPAVTTRNLLSLSSSSPQTVLDVATSGVIRSRANGASADSASVHASAGASAVRQICLYRNATANRSGTVTDLGSIVNVHDETASTGRIKGLSVYNAGDTPTYRVGWLAFFKGANAEFDPAAYLARLRGD